jgi:hypothetical protein
MSSKLPEFNFVLNFFTKINEKQPYGGYKRKKYGGAPTTLTVGEQIKIREIINSRFNELLSIPINKMSPFQLLLKSIYDTIKAEIQMQPLVLNEIDNQIHYVDTGTQTIEEEPKVKTEEEIQIIDDKNKIIINTTHEIENISTSSNLKEVIQNSSSCFTNLLGRIFSIFETIAEFKTNFIEKNRFTIRVLSLLYSLISFLFFSLFSIFKLLFFYLPGGRIILFFIFCYLYKTNNIIAVFIANLFSYMLQHISETLKIQEYIQQCFQTITTMFIDNLPSLLQTSAFSAILKTALTETFTDPTLISNIVQSLVPKLNAEISTELLNSLLPKISTNFATLLSSNSEVMSELIKFTIDDNIKTLPATVMEQLKPILIEGITSSMSPLTGAVTNLPNVLTDVVNQQMQDFLVSFTTETAKQNLRNQLTSQVLNSDVLKQLLSKFAIGTASAVALTSKSLLSKTGGRSRKSKTKKRKFKKRVNI